MKNRYALIQRGLFPETLPPCFTSEDVKRALRGIVPSVRAKEFHNKRSTDYVRYNGTKHDGSRRYFGTPNPISYFYVADFIAENWSKFENRFASSPFSVSQPKVADETADRPIIIPSLSELTSEASKKIGFSPYILKTDIAQFFPSIYTHSIPWSAHGIDASKNDTDPKSKALPFNRLDFLVRNCQMAETKGVLVGPDAFRLVSEFVAAGIDSDLHKAVGEHIVGAARHVDDYYIGLRSETAALVVLSALRDQLQRYNLSINDGKTKILSGLEPLNEVWAQQLRQDARRLRGWQHGGIDDTLLFVNKALEVAAQTKSDSPVKIAVRTLDQISIYKLADWEYLEPYLQRIMFHHPHAIDYVALLVVKRVAIGKAIDRNGWQKSASDLLKRHLAFNHHHEIVWLVWIILCCDLEMDDDLLDLLCGNQNAHVRSLLIAGYVDGRIKKKPTIKLGNKLPTTDHNWLVSLVARSTGFSKSSFSGAMASEFEHLATKKIILINFQAHLNSVKKSNVNAISRTRYGYDADDEEDVFGADLDADDDGFFDM